MSLDLHHAIQECSDCMHANLTGERMKPEHRRYDNFQSIWAICREHHCEEHANLWVRDILLPLVISYGNYTNQAAELGYLSTAADIIEDDRAQTVLNDLLFEIEIKKLSWVISTYLRPSTVTAAGGKIRDLLKNLTNSRALDDEEHAPVLVEHVLNTLRGTGELSHAGHLLDIAEMAAHHPEVLWSWSSRSGSAHQNLLLPMALKIPFPSQRIMDFPHQTEWVVSAIIARFYGSSPDNMLRFDMHLFNSVAVYPSDQDYMSRVHPGQKLRFIEQFGETCNLFFEWMEFLSSEHGGELSDSQAMDLMEEQYLGFLRPRSVTTLRRRVRGSELLEMEFSEQKLREMVGDMARKGYWKNTSTSSMQMILDPDSIAYFDLSSDKYQEWSANRELYSIFKGSRVESYDEAIEWVVAFRRRNVSQNRMKELAHSGVPLEWALATIAGEQK